MSVEIVVCCRECKVTRKLRTHLALTKFGVFRLEGGSAHWYVDGGGAFCPAHRPDPEPSPQRETWGDYDRRMAEMEADALADL